MEETESNSGDSGTAPYLMRGSTPVGIPDEGLELGIEAGLTSAGGVKDESPLAAIAGNGSRHNLVALAGHGLVRLNHEAVEPGEYRMLRPDDLIEVGSESFRYTIPEGMLPTLARPDDSIPATRFSAPDSEVVIGRDPYNDISLPFPTVSRRHAIVRPENGHTVIEDCQSANGTRVNGQKVREAVLSPGDRISIGPYRIVFDGMALVEETLPDGLGLEARGVSLRVGSMEILTPTDVDIDAGSLVAFVGESGAGKTTLLKMLAGVTSPSGGFVLCGGEPVAAQSLEIGYVPQFDVVHGQLTVFEALDFAARLRLPPDLTKAERHERIDEVLEQLGLSQRRDLRVDRLSGGQRKRVSVGIELLHRPRVLFLDEPTTGIDPGIERTMMSLFRELSRSGQTVVLVTHATRSISLCDKVVVMGAGGIKRFEGSPHEALRAFDVDDFDEVYERLAEGYAPLEPALGTAEPASSRARKTGISKDQISRPRLLSQTLILTSRYALLMARNRRNLLSLAIQTVVLGLLTSVIFEANVFEELSVNKSTQLTFLMVVIAIWIGCINSAREIVKERELVSRELTVGVGVNSYLVSKILVLFPLVAVQIIAFFLVVSASVSITPSASAFLVILVLAGWISVMLGLVVSAYSRSQDQATSLIPIVLVPQLLFGGALVTLDQIGGVGKLIASVVPARWAYESSGTVLELYERMLATQDLGSNGSRSRELGEEEMLVQSANATLEANYTSDFFNLGISQFSLVTLCFLVATYGFLVFAVSRFSSE